MTEPIRPKIKVQEALLAGRLVRCTAAQYPEVRAWLLELLPLFASRHEVEAAVFTVAEVKRLDYELDYTSRAEQG